MLRIQSNKNLLGLVFAQRQVVAAYLDFHRIAEWREADQFNRSPHQQAHFEQATAVFGRHFDFRDGGGGADRQGCERLSTGGHNSGHLLFLVQRFDQDGVRQFRADAEPDVANLADDIVLLTEQFDALFLAKAEFAEAPGHFRRGGKLFDPAGGAHPHLAERTNVRLRDAVGGTGRGRFPFHSVAVYGN